MSDVMQFEFIGKMERPLRAPAGRSYSLSLLACRLLRKRLR